MVNIGRQRSSNDSRTVVEAVRRVLTDGTPTACAGVKSEILDGAVTTVSVETLCEAAGCLEWSRWGIDGKQPTHCLEHGLDVHTSAAAVEMTRAKEDDHSSSSLGARTRLNDSGGDSGISAKRTRHRLYRRPLPP
ncbi:unnamed protein product [Laminaria digitata]